RITTAKGEYLASQVTNKGRAAAEILAETVPREVAALYWPKNMYWRKATERFVRPVRWVVALFDKEVIPLQLYGVAAANQTQGHRLLAAGPVTVPSAGPEYLQALGQAKVLARSAREKKIREELDASTRRISGARWREDKELLDSVINLTEF